MFDDRDALHAHVGELSDRHEAGFAEPWHVDDAPPDYMERQLKGIVGFRFTIEALEGKLKLSQNRSEADRAAVAAALSVSADDNARSVAARMQVDKQR